MRYSPLLLLALTGCDLLGARHADVSVQRVQATPGEGQSTYLSMRLLATRGGQAIQCDGGDITASVRVSTTGEGDWVDIPQSALSIACEPSGAGDMALVVDNSGSLQSTIDQVRASARSLAGGVLEAGGGASVVRVSTNASVEVPVTDDAERIEQALATMYVANGWTALWDGIRMGNETLGGSATDRLAEATDLESWCDRHQTLGIVAFTDGQENNSADQQQYDHNRYPGDGFATTLGDLHNLKVQGTTTPIYTVGLGRDVDHGVLEELADSTGGRHQRVSTLEEAAAAFENVEDYFDASHRVCAQIPAPHCGPLWVEVDWAWNLQGEGSERDQGSRTETYRIDVDCPTVQTGRMVVVVMTMSNVGVPADFAASLADQAVGWVTPVPGPKVLVVRDDDHHGEFPGDGEYVTGLLRTAGYDVTYLEEPRDGITEDHLRGYDVLWFVNPGYPVDDLGSMQAMEAFGSAGGGVVLQGDDISYSMGQNFDMSPWTGLKHLTNGTHYCDVHTEDNKFEQLRVTVDQTEHPVTAGLGGVSFLHGDDIDHTLPLGLGEQVLAWATLAEPPECVSVPVIVARDPRAQ